MITIFSKKALPHAPIGTRNEGGHCPAPIASLLHDQIRPFRSSVSPLQITQARNSVLYDLATALLCYLRMNLRYIYINHADLAVRVHVNLITLAYTVYIY